MTPTPTRRMWGISLAVGLVLTAGCGTSPTSSDSASDLTGATLTVASKDFTEQHILGEIAVQALEAAGAQVVNRVGLSGSQNVRELLLDGQIDLYWEYTGTAWTNYLGRTERFATVEEQHAELAAADLHQHDVRWLTPAPVNNSYAIATTTATSRSTGVESISDLARLVRHDPATVHLCVADEFLTRADGLPGLQRHYDFRIEPDRIHALAIHDLDRAVARGAPCNFGEVFTTSVDLTENDLVVLDDDERFFALYHPAVVVRAETARRHPQLIGLFDAIATQLSQDVVVDMNRQVEDGGRPPARVAEDWVRSVLSDSRS